MAIETINPANGKVIKSYKEAGDAYVDQTISKMQIRFYEWRRLSFDQRAEYFRNAAKILREKTAKYAELMTIEMGKPLKQSRSEIEKCAWVCEYYAENAASFLQPRKVESDARESYVAFEPQGIILAIMPWNFPLWQAFRAAVPAMMAGNVMILKHASNVSGSALAMAEIFKEAGFPENAFEVFILSSKKIPRVIANPNVRGVTLTGSVPAGKSVAATAGEYLKPVVLELGGSDPYIILEDADLDKAVKACAQSRLINGGQSCVAAKRFIVVESVKDEFEKGLVEAMKANRLGDPMNEETDIGPMAREDLRDELHEQVTESVKQGAKLLLGGEIPKMEGAFYPATVLTDVTEGIKVFHEETFGPVASIIPVKDEAEAIRVANESVFGLGAAVFTKDEKRGRRIAEKELDAGLCFVNDFVKSDPRLPFGGVKESGYGRELGAYGILEFVNIKTVGIN